MKDEEMAEELKQKAKNYAWNYPIPYSLYEKIEDKKEQMGEVIEQAFLAGFKAGRPQWHKADVSTSPINKVVLGYIKDYNSKKYCLVKWNGEWWYDARTWNDKVKLIAWKEIVLPELKENE